MATLRGLSDALTDNEFGDPRLSSFTRASASERILSLQERERHAAVRVKKIQKLWNLCESENQMHRLAANYFAFRHFYFLFLPAAVLTLLSGVLSFLSTSDAVTDSTSSDKTKDTLASIVGAIALVASFLQTINDQLKWSSRAEMHKSAQTDLKKIVDDLEFKEMSLDTEDSGTQHEMGHSVKIETYEKMYAQVMLGCKSSVPINIYQAFNTIETRVQLELLPADKDDNGAPLLHGTVTPAVFMSMIYNELYCIIASKWYFPLALPDADLVMKETFKRTREKLLQQIESASENTPGNGPTFGQLLLRRQQVLGVEAPLPGREGRSRHPEVHKGKSNVDTAGVREEPSLTRTTEADLNATTV
eukprot:m.407625 g.407625  ORF g.407625 m.407625 type:complete len:361 (-) comp21228_c1_seq3:433-1515(-)